MSRRIGFIGLGSMGSIMAARLLSAGFDIWVNNRSQERAEDLLCAGAQWVDDAEALADRVDTLITMVSDDAALSAVTTGDRGLLRRPHPQLIYADMSTVSPAASRRVSDAADRAGVAYVRAPVTGSTSLAEAGALGVLASGPKEAVETLDDAFAAMAKRVFYLGPGEEARAMKLALNALVATTVVGLSEALVFGRQCGLGWQHMLDVFSDSAVASPLVQYKATALAERDFAAAFTTEMMTKDLDVALKVGREAGAAMPTTALNHELLRAVCGLGWADQDFSAAVLMYEQFTTERQGSDRVSTELTTPEQAAP